MAQIWIGSIDGSWIDDPELQGWWDEWWKRKGQTIAGILCDAIGDIFFTWWSGDNPYVGIIGGAHASVAFFWLVAQGGVNNGRNSWSYYWIHCHTHHSSYFEEDQRSGAE